MYRKSRFINCLLYVTFSVLLPAFIITSLPARAVYSVPFTKTLGQAESQARAALSQGKAFLRRNRADQARGYLETALSLFSQTGDKSGEAAVHDALGDIYIRYAQYGVALRHYQNSYAAFSASRESSNSDTMLIKIGEAYYLMGETSEARTAFARVSEKNRSALAIILENGGMERGMNALGASSEGQSSTVTNVTIDSPGEVSCFRPTKGSPLSMGYAPTEPDGMGRLDVRVFDKVGNPVEGARVMLESKRRNGYTCYVEGITDSFGRVVLPPLNIGELKLKVRADGFLTQQLKPAAEELALPVLITLQASQANYLANHVKPCLDLYRLFINYATSEFGMGRADYFDNQLDSAQNHFKNVLAAASVPRMRNLRQMRRFRVAARTSMADVASRQGHYTDALKLYSEATDGARQDGRVDLTWASQRGAGRTLWTLAGQETDAMKAAKYRDEALGAYRLSLQIIETILAGSLHSDEARTSFLATTKDVFDEASSALAEMAMPLMSSASSPLTGQALEYAAEAYKITEQGRARSLLDLLGETRIEISEGVPPELLKRKADNQARQQEIAQLLTGISLEDDKIDGTIEELEAELDTLFIEYADLEKRIRAVSPRYASLTKAQPLTLAAVQQQVLDDKTVLLEYSLGKEQSYLWAVTKSGATLSRLAARSVLEQRAAELRDQIVPHSLRRSIIDLASDQSQRGLAVDRGVGLATTPAAQDASTFAATANTFYKMAVEPAASIIGDKRLLIVAEGALSYIPFEALVTRAPESADYTTLSYLIKTNEVVYAPSASIVAALRQQNTATTASRAGGAILLVADPIFDASDPRVLGGRERGGEATRGLSLGIALADVAGTQAEGTYSSKLKLMRLTGTRTEAQQIAEFARASGLKTDLWLDLEASEANVMSSDMRQYRILHVATHGILNIKHPQFTGLVLSLVGNRKGDGFLRTDEVFNLRLGAPLVILSACETGLGKEKRGEGVIGLTRAFMYAGAQTVGVSLWSVADRSTAELMSNFYKRLLLRQGTPSSAALRDAQLDMITDDRFSAPFYWAPFVLFGDWR
jgi:CHAT domain-containing protein